MSVGWSFSRSCHSTMKWIGIFRILNPVNDATKRSRPDASGFNSRNRKHTIQTSSVPQEPHFVIALAVARKKELHRTDFIMRKLIRASAGSGKTFQLSSHFLRQLFQGHAPETILATTFTRKAAGEIQGRVLLRLAEAADDAKAAKKLAEFLEQPDITQPKSRDLLVQVTRNLHRLRVCTLDSFFQQVARSLTLELGLPPGWSIIDEHTDAELREQAIDAVLSQQVPEDAQNLMHMLAKGRSKRSVRDLIDETVKSFHE